MVVTGSDIAGIISAIALLLTAIGSIGGMIMGIINSRKIEEVHKTTNSKMDQMLEVSNRASKAEGKEEARVEQVVIDLAKETVEVATKHAFEEGKQETVAAAIEGNVAEKRIAKATEELVKKEEK